MKLLSLRTSLIASVLAASALLTACEPVVMGSAVVAGTMAATDRRTVGIQVEDRTIAFKADNRISDKFGDKAHVNINSYNRKALLTGEVPSEAAKQEVEKIVLGVENVQTVVNELAVLGVTSISGRTSDSIITGKVKASFVDAKDVFANAFRVTTERGVVYLQGLVTQREGDRAAQIARTVGGVQKVVKVFDYISEEELARMSQRPAEQAPPDSNKARN